MAKHSMNLCFRPCSFPLAWMVALASVKRSYRAMTTREIEAMLVLRGEDVEALADAINEKANRISETINYSRINRRIREKLAQYFNMPVERLFDQPPTAAAQGA